MTWFRVGGAGIPASLRNGMNSVLNKKFGTSTTYDPSGWPDDVNLMGPLPVKIASGAIASFSDGADDVPVKSCVVSFLPSGGGGTPSAPVSIQGVSGLSVTQLGKNLASLSDVTQKESQNCSYSYSNGGIEITANSSYARIAFTIPLVVGVQYTFSFKGFTSGDYKRVSLRYGDAWSNFIYNQAITDTEASYSYTFTASENHIYIGFYVTASNTSGSMTIKDVQIEVGSTATTYSAYVTPSVVTDTLGQTLYGGTRDLTTDKASVTYSEPVVLTESMIDSATTYSYQSKNGIQIAAVFPENVYRLNNHRCSHDVVKQGADSASHYLWFGSSNGNKALYWIGILDDLNMTLAEWKAWAKTQTIQCSYVLPTPTEITGLTPHSNISTLYGDNNFYADTGDTSVEYRADIDLALQALSSSRGLMMASRPVTQMIGEESDPDQVNELVEDDETEQEGENDAR